ncbi:MAG: hypothetical protein WBI34_03625, partial [Tenuifilaceae bacterium]
IINKKTPMVAQRIGEHRNRYEKLPNLIFRLIPPQNYSIIRFFLPRKHLIQTKPTKRIKIIDYALPVL